MIGGNGGKGEEPQTKTKSVDRQKHHRNWTKEGSRK